MRLIAALCLLLVWAVPLAAGPWPRPAGERFISLSRDGGGTSLWVESGIDGRQWLVGQARRDRGGARFLGLSWRRSLVAEDAVQRLAVSLGAEYRDRGARAWLRPGMMWGRGFERPVPGWVAASVVASVPLRRTASVELNGALTLGARPVPQWLTMVQFQGERDQSESRFHLAPSVAWEWRAGSHLQLGLRQRLGGDRRRSVTLASWLRF